MMRNKVVLSDILFGLDVLHKKIKESGNRIILRDGYIYKLINSKWVKVKEAAKSDYELIPEINVYLNKNK